MSELIKALIEAQKAFKPVKREKTNPFYNSKYADLEAVDEATGEALRANGLVVMQYVECGAPMTNTIRKFGVVELADKDGSLYPSLEIVEAEGPTFYLVTELAHTSGESRASRYPFTQADPQAMGSAMTYARRYAKMAILGIAPEDDDGNSATTRKVGPAKQAAPASRPLTEGARAAAPAGPLKVKQVVSKDGTNAKTGTAYKLFTVVLSDGRSASTFSESLATLAHECKLADFEVEVSVSKTGYGLKLETLTTRERAVTKMIPGADPKDSGESAPVPPPGDDDLPF